jgi:hypothetical protein
MPFDVFRLREHVVQEYRDYVESFVHVLDPRIDGFVRERLAEGELWPEAVLQLNPAYEPGGTLAELAGRREILAETARFFGPELRLHRHQAEALAAARRRSAPLREGGRSCDEQYAWLCEHADPSSPFEREFLDHLYEEKLKLPDFAQYTPASDVFVQPDFYYRRGEMTGVCVFIDGPQHDEDF